MYATVDRTKAKYKKKPKANVQGKGAMVVAIAEADRAEHLVDVGTVYRNVAQWIWCA